jgi:hypothetical protein
MRSFLGESVAIFLEVLGLVRWLTVWASLVVGRIEEGMISIQEA